jgi:hypothetical protein
MCADSGFIVITSLLTTTPLHSREQWERRQLARVFFERPALHDPLCALSTVPLYVYLVYSQCMSMCVWGQTEKRERVDAGFICKHMHPYYLV